jgi:TonB-linked SusC/RagA family outer membrane protein
MKDAEATALYGSKGANGVIVITTKRGNSKVPIVRYTGNIFFDFPPQLRKTIGGRAERAYRVGMIENTGNIDDIYKISQTQFLSDSLNPFYNNSTNWQGLYYQLTTNQTHNIQVSGGNQQLNYKTNLNYYTEKGVIKNTGYNSYTLSLNVNFQPTERLQASGHLSGGLGKKLKGSGNGLTDVGAGSAISSSLLPGPSYFINVGHFTDALYRKNDSRTYNARAYLNIAYEVIKNLRLSTNTSYDFTSDLEDTYTPALANNEQPAIYGYTGRKSSLYNRSMVTYNNVWNKKHSIYISAFSETEIDQNLNTIINRNNGPNDSYYGPLGYNSYFSSISGVPVNGGYAVTHTEGLAANFQYDYDKKYVINLNYRQDGNSYAGEKNRWAKSPSVGLRWNFNKEKFLEKSTWLDYGDFRFSYGINLRPTTNIFASQGWYDINGNYNDVTRISPHLGLMPNPYLKPEKVKQYNYGFDLGLKQGRFGVTFDFYTKTVYDMIYDQSLPTSTGFKDVFTNDASLYNYGYEVQFTIRPFPTTSKVNWTINLNWAMDKNILLALPGGAAQSLSGDGTIVNRVGYEALLNFLYISQGVYRTDEDVPVDPVTGLAYHNADGTIYRGGDMKFEDVDGNYITNNTDLQVAGTPVPRYTGGFSSYLTYKNYSINFNGSFTLGRKLLNNALASRMANLRSPFTQGTLVDLNAMDYWKGPGDVARYPNPFAYQYNTDPYRELQTLYQEDGSYIKLNALTVAYSFDRELTERYGIRAVRLYATVTNLFMITNYSGPNPEAVSELGRDGLGTYPIARTLAFGLNVEF